MECTLYQLVGKFGESSVIRQTKTIFYSYNYNLSLFIPQTFFAKCSKWVNSPNFCPAKLFYYMVCIVCIKLLKK